MELNFGKMIGDKKFKNNSEAEDEGALQFLRMFNGGVLRN